MKFRKKPIVVEAEQLLKGALLPKGVTWNPQKDIYYIDTLEGRLYVSIGYWIINGVKGERYPCSPDIFEATYEPISSEKGGKGT